VLHCITVRCGALQCVVVRCSALQCVVVRCGALQCVAVHCSESVWHILSVNCSAVALCCTLSTSGSPQLQWIDCSSEICPHCNTQQQHDTHILHTCNTLHQHSLYQLCHTKCPNGTDIQEGRVCVCVCFCVCVRVIESDQMRVVTPLGL